MNGKILRKKILRKKQGFTLIELMVVLLIIGILTSLIAVNVFRAQKQAKIKAASIEIKSLEQAINLFQGENKVFMHGNQKIQLFLRKKKT